MVIRLQLFYMLICIHIKYAIENSMQEKVSMAKRTLKKLIQQKLLLTLNALYDSTG